MATQYLKGGGGNFFELDQNAVADLANVVTVRADLLPLAPFPKHTMSLEA
jgi:hypothetical protein